MSRTELQREFAREDAYVGGMVDGIMKKYAKKMKVAGENCLLGITRYTNPTTRNNLVVAWCKVWNGHFNEIYYTYLIEFIDNHKRNWVMSINGTAGGSSDAVRPIAIVYTQHALERLKERAGLDFEGFIKEAYKSQFRNKQTYYTYNGVQSVAFALGDKGLFLLDVNDWGTVCKTFVSTDLLGEVQTDTLSESKEKTKEYSEYLNDKANKDADRFFNSLNRENRRKIKKFSKVV